MRNTGIMTAGDRDGQKQHDPREEIQQQQKRVAGRLALIDNTLVVLSGKGGVGKSTVAVNLALALSLQGRRVGLLDVDMHGPSVPRMLGLDDARLASDGKTIHPASHTSGLKVMSIAFLMEKREDAIIWRGPLKMNVLRQLLADVEWGELDYLIFDLPPGTGDEPLSLCQLISSPDGGIVVTTPQEVALSDVRKCIDFCRKLNLPVVGVIENMSGFICPHCGENYDIFGRDGARKMSGEMGVPFLGSIPLDPEVVQACDNGTMNMEHFKESGVAEAFGDVVEKVRVFCES